MSITDNIISLFELEDVNITECISNTNENYLFIEVPRKNHICPCCGCVTQTIHDYRLQKIIDVPIYDKKTFLIYRKRRYRCRDCGKRFFENNSFLPRYSHTTNRLFLKIFQDLHSVVSQKHIANQYKISPMRVRRVLDGHTPTLPTLPEVIGIDEFRGNTNKTKYHCILTDLSTNSVLDILPNRTQAALRFHFKKYQYTGQLSNVKIIVIDMWSVYYETLREIFPHATIIIDRFHFVRHAIWSLENVRKRIQKELPDSLRVYFKKSRFILLKRADKLIVTDTINEIRQRDRMLEFYPELMKAYQLKEDMLWMVQTVHNKQEALGRLNQWIHKAEESKIPEFRSTIRAYRNWKAAIINAFDYPYSNGMTEGSNNKIKVIKRNAFGLRNFLRFRTRILLAFSKVKDPAFAGSYG